jgi:hypothetical protein
LLGLPEDDTVMCLDAFGNTFRVSGWGRRDNVARFAQAAAEIRVCVRIYEALTSPGDIDLGELSVPMRSLPWKEGGSQQHRKGEERSWLYGVVAYMVQARLNEYCYPKLTTYTRGGSPTGKFALSWGFKGLIGAIWLQMAWLLEAEGTRVRRCKLPDCLRVIEFKSGKPPPDEELRGFGGKFKTNVRGKYRTRSDTQFCKGRGCKQKYHYRKKAGWKGYG